QRKGPMPDAPREMQVVGAAEWRSPGNLLADIHQILVRLHVFIDAPSRRSRSAAAGRASHGRARHDPPARHREARPIVKIELNNAIKRREKLRRHVSWN